MLIPGGVGVEAFSANTAYFNNQELVRFVLAFFKEAWLDQDPE